jgi:hypothetical protein
MHINFSSLSYIFLLTVSQKLLTSYTYTIPGGAGRHGRRADTGRNGADEDQPRHSA